MAAVPDLAELRIPSSIEEIKVPRWISDIKAEDFPEFVADIVRAYLYGLRTGDFSKVREELEAWEETVELCYDLSSEEICVRWRDVRDV